MYQEANKYYLYKGKDLLNSHITKFEVQNGAWIGELAENEEGQKIIQCKDYDNNLVRTIPLNEDTVLDYTVKALAYTDERYGKIRELQAKINVCEQQLENARNELDELREEMRKEEIVNKLDIDFEQVKEDMQAVCNCLNACETLQDISNYADLSWDLLGNIIFINSFDEGYEEIEEAIEDGLELKDISFIRFETLGKVDYPTFYFKEGKVDIDNVWFDIWNENQTTFLYEDAKLSDFINLEMNKDNFDLDER